MTSPFAFTHALCRGPGLSAVHGLRAGGGDDPDFGALRAEHDAYVGALAGLGLTVELLGPLKDFPDALFVEDVALTFAEGAVLLRPGAPSRAGEVAHIADALSARFGTLLGVEEGAVDGGDVLLLPDRLLVGLSARTDRTGAEALARELATLDRVMDIVETPSGVLHFKTGCALLTEECVVAVPALAECPAFAGLEVLVTPAGEEAAANLVRFGDTVLVRDDAPRLADAIARRGLAVLPMQVAATAMLDAGLSCLSLRW